MSSRLTGKDKQNSASIYWTERLPLINGLPLTRDSQGKPVAWDWDIGRLTRNATSWPRYAGFHKGWPVKDLG